MLRLESLSITLGEFRVKNVSLEVHPGEYFILLGPSGAGKTVLLETIAGIHRPDSGWIFLGDQDITNLEPRRRNIGMVYQDYMLFPHLTVEKNIAFGLRQRGVSRDEQDKRVHEIGGLLGILPLLGRYPGTLSGGEQQRVALARALVLRPGVLLLDEPMNALDSRTRDRLMAEISRIRRHTGTAIIHITHHFDEVFALADRLAVMVEGEIIQVGDPSEIFLHPCSRIVAEFLCIGNLIRGFAARDGNLVCIKPVKGPVFYSSATATGDIIATLHAEDVIVSREPFTSSARNSLPATVSEIIPFGNTVRVILDAGFPLTAVLTRESCHDLDLTQGERVYATFKASAVHVIASEPQ